MPLTSLPSGPDRLVSVDYSKGLCIILVVLMHSTLGVEKAVGQVSWLSGFIEWAKPFRMPDFFLVSGLFLFRRIDAPWMRYLDSKVLHFAYFYLLWMTIQFLFKGPGMVVEQGLAATVAAWLSAFVDPFGTLWFIYMLAVFFVVAKLLRPVNPLVVWLVAALLEALPIGTGFVLIDEFASRFVFFYTGYLLGPRILAAAQTLGTGSIRPALAGLIFWAALNTALVATGLAGLPGISLLLGLAGGAAIITIGVLLARLQLLGWLRQAGANSLTIYLAFFLFMAGSRTMLVKLPVPLDPGGMALLVTLAGVAGPLILSRVTRNGPLRFLFERPPFSRFPAGQPAMTTGSQCG